MWRRLVASGLVASACPLCFVTSALAQQAIPVFQTLDQPQQAQPAAGPQAGNPGAGQVGVNVFETLKPLPPTSTASRITPSSAGGQPAAASPTDQSVIQTDTVTLFPGLTYATYYDDNVFALPTSKRGDWAFVLRPEVSFRSRNLDGVVIGGNAYMEGRKYATYESEDQVNAGAWIGGQAALGQTNQIVGRLAYTHGHEDRGVSDTITDRFLDPIGYHQGEASAALNSRFGSFWTSVGAQSVIAHYDDALLTNGFAVSQDYRNGNIERFPVRLGYVVAPLTSVFVEASAHRRDFENSLYDSLGYRVVGGLLLEPGQGSRVRGEVFAGYMNQDYSGLTLKTVSTWTAGASMSFLITDNWTATVEGRRDPREASLSGGVFQNFDGVSIIESVASLRTDYHFLPNLVAGVGASYIQDHFQDAARTDWAWSPLASIKYSVTPKFTVGLDYRYVNFHSSAFGIPGYERNVYLLSANLQF